MILNTDLHCNGTLEAELDDTVTIICELGNVGTTALEAISVFQDDAVILNETWSNGTASTLDGSLTLTYTAYEIVVNIARIQCHHGAVYTISVNNMLSDNATVVIKSMYRDLILSYHVLNIISCLTI